MINPSKKRKESEHGSEKSIQGNRTGASKKRRLADDEIEVNGEIIKMAEDLKDLPEIDYDDPEVKEWMAEEQARSIRLYGRMTSEEVEYMYARRLELQKVLPDKSVVELNQMALAEIRSGNRQPVSEGSL